MSMILYCNLVQFLSPVFEGAQHQSLAMILICGVRTSGDDSLLQPGSVPLAGFRVPSAPVSRYEVHVECAPDDVEVEYSRVPYS